MDTEQHDMLIRIDERTLTTKTDVDAIKKTLQKLPCSVQQEKVKNLEKGVWGALFLGIATAVKIVSDLIFKQG